MLLSQGSALCLGSSGHWFGLRHADVLIGSWSIEDCEAGYTPFLNLVIVYIPLVVPTDDIVVTEWLVSMPDGEQINRYTRFNPLLPVDFPVSQPTA